MELATALAEIVDCPEDLAAWPVMIRVFAVRWLREDPTVTGVGLMTVGVTGGGRRVVLT
jgi:hypothetical protein